nr:MAG: hypothetical protein DIU72_12315 [Pseudomonadota bacterium]
MPNNRFWVLGASDPEMELIEKLLIKCKEAVVYATAEDGKRVHPGNAYRCPVPSVPENSTVYAVECIDELPEGWIRIDHHRPGDPGYGRPPEDFFAASSVGQVLAELDRFGVTDRLSAADIIEAIHAAAADHCLAAAYRGECPGVDPDALMRWRVATRAAFQGRSPEELLADVERARAALREAPSIDLGAGTSVRDMRDTFVPELPEAAVRDGVAYLGVVADRDGRRKVVLGGHTTPETVRAFMADWAPSQGLVNVYGDPARGFAGGYLPPHDAPARAETGTN